VSYVLHASRQRPKKEEKRTSEVARAAQRRGRRLTRTRAWREPPAVPSHYEAAPQRHRQGLVVARPPTPGAASQRECGGLKPPDAA
jgi:hypothetical protein